MVAIAAGCGGSTQVSRPRLAPSPVLTRQWLSYNATIKSVTLTLVPGATNEFNGYNFNGYGRGAVLVDVPRGWRVTVRCRNTASSLRHSCAIVRDGGDATAPVFPGASTPDPQTGLPPGHSAQFAFEATRIGAYRISCLVPEHETMGMWDGFEISSSRLPSVRQVRAY